MTSKVARSRGRWGQVGGSSSPRLAKERRAQSTWLHSIHVAGVYGCGPQGSRWSPASREVPMEYAIELNGLIEL
jgi:hypothetical protein